MILLDTTASFLNSVKSVKIVSLRSRIRCRSVVDPISSRCRSCVDPMSIDPADTMSIKGRSRWSHVHLISISHRSNVDPMSIHGRSPRSHVDLISILRRSNIDPYVNPTSIRCRSCQYQMSGAWFHAKMGGPEILMASSPHFKQVFFSDEGGGDLHFRWGDLLFWLL